jgi:uncharacterized protein (DUF885 family)
MITSPGRRSSIRWRPGCAGSPCPYARRPITARNEASRRQLSAGKSFDLKRWHTAALSLGPIGLAGLSDALAEIDDSDR